MIARSFDGLSVSYAVTGDGPLALVFIHGGLAGAIASTISWNASSLACAAGAQSAGAGESSRTEWFRKLTRQGRSPDAFTIAWYIASQTTR